LVKVNGEVVWAQGFFLGHVLDNIFYFLYKIWPHQTLGLFGGNHPRDGLNYFGDFSLSVNLRFIKEVPIIIHNLLLDVLLFNFGSPIL
jgi:hypothetical protein